MLSLGDQVGGQERRVGRVVGDQQALGRAGQPVDGDGAVDLLLRQRDEDVARAEDLVDPADRLGAVRQGGDGLGAADSVDRVDAGHLRGGQQDRRDLAVRPGGEASTTSRTPATRAGTTAISTDDGYGARPPGA